MKSLQALGEKLYGCLVAVDHLSIGRRFIFTAFGFLALGGLLALVMRLQLAIPGAEFVGPDVYAQLFTVHGTNMMFLFAVPVFQGLALYFVPLMVGAKELAFPRLSAFAYWLYLFAGLLLWGGLISNTGPDMGWFSYVPLAGPEHSAGKRVDVWAQMVSMTEISGICTATTLITTIVKLRAPGMTIDRMPIFVWSMLVTSLMIIFAMPAVATASTMLALDRLVATQFFNHVEGGDPVLWQHLFWFFGHPEVYIIFLPGLGLVSMIVVSAAQRPLFGYVAIVLANVATGLLAFGLWVHHMFAVDLPKIGESFFTAASMLIAIPTGTQIFCWIATLWGSRPKLTVSFAYILGFFIVFVVGGLSGVMLASVPIDLQVHDSFFVVAHFHYVLIGGAVFPLLGAMTHWWPKLTGRLLDARLGWVAFALIMVGFNVTFFPQHQLGIDGMPRRVYTYVAGSGWGPKSFLSSVGSAILGLGFGLFFLNALLARKYGVRADANPWGADTLEWGLASPPPPPPLRHVPTVRSKYPLWEPALLGRVTGLEPNHGLVTTMVEAKPDHKLRMVGPSLAPLAAAMATAALFVGFMFSMLALYIGTACVALALLGWGWPRHPKPRDLAEEQP